MSATAAVGDGGGVMSGHEAYAPIVERLRGVFSRPSRERLQEDLAAADARLLELEDEVGKLETKLSRLAQQHAGLSERLAVALDNEERLAAQVYLLMEPATDGACQKIRLRSESEARAFAARLLTENGDVTEPYKCKTCPRQPLGLTPFWHVRNVDRALRGEAGRIARGARRHHQRVNGPNLMHQMSLEKFKTDTA